MSYISGNMCAHIQLRTKVLYVEGMLALLHYSFTSHATSCSAEDVTAVWPDTLRGCPKLQSCSQRKPQVLQYISNKHRFSVDCSQSTLTKRVLLVLTPTLYLHSPVKSLRIMTTCVPYRCNICCAQYGFGKAVCIDITCIIKAKVTVSSGRTTAVPLMTETMFHLSSLLDGQSGDCSWGDKCSISKNKIGKIAQILLKLQL